MAKAQVTYRDGQFFLLVAQGSGEIREVELSQQAVQLLLFSASHALGSQKADPVGDPLRQPPMIDAEVQALMIGSDDKGRAVLIAQLPLLPPMQLRFVDELAREIVDKFREVLESPADVRLSM